MPYPGPPAYTIYQWSDSPSTSTPLDKSHLEAAEQSMADRVVAVATDVAAYVDSQGLITVNTQTGATYTLVLADAGRVIEGNRGAAQSFTLPPATFSVGQSGEVFQRGGGQITLVAGAGVTLLSNAARVKTSTQYSSVAWRYSATNEYVLTGDLA